MGDRAKLDNFEACQQYLKTISFTKANQDILQRNISNTNTGGQPRGSKRGGKGGGGGGGKALGRSYTNEEWQKLTPEQRDKIRALRAAQKKQRTDPNNNNNTRGGGGDLHSNVSSITTGDSQQVATATTNNNANQNQNDGATQVTNGSRQGGANSRG
jgi:Spy/CpxP family protein refolding chaperone